MKSFHYLKHFLDRLTKAGIKYTKSTYDAKSLILVNYISIILFIAVLLLLVIRYYAFDILPTIQVISCAFLFLTPLLLNQFGFLRTSLLCVCWLPSMSVLWVHIINMKAFTIVLASQYDSLSIFLLSVSAIPFLVLNLKNRTTFAIGIFIPMVILFFVILSLIFLK